jgi:hypothetical protein
VNISETHTCVWLRWNPAVGAEILGTRTRAQLSFIHLIQFVPRLLTDLTQIEIRVPSLSLSMLFCSHSWWPGSYLGGGVFIVRAHFCTGDQVACLSAPHGNIRTTGITPRSKVFLEKLIVPQLINKFAAFYSTWRFMTVFTRTRNSAISWVRWVQFTTSYPIQLRTILILFSPPQLACTLLSESVKRT